MDAVQAVRWLAAVVMVFILLKGVRSWIRRRGSRRRMPAVAGRLGMEYLPHGNVAVSGENFLQLPLFARDSDREFLNLLRTEGEWLFDFEYGSQSVGHSQRIRTAVAALRDDRCVLPYFRIAPRSATDRIRRQVLPAGRAEPGDDGSFSRLYDLDCDEEDARQVCGAAVRNFLAANPGWSVEGSSEWLIVYRHGQGVDAERIGKFREQARRIAGYVRGGVS